MTMIYIKRIKANLMTIEQVPSLWRADVKDLLAQDVN